MISLSEQICYFDDSFDQEIHVVGGYLAPVEVWEQIFAPAWQRVIENAPHGITEFKSSNSRKRTEEFRSWTPGEVEELTNELVSVLSSTPLYAGVSAAFLWPGNPDPSSPKVRKWRKQTARVGYSQCIRSCLGNAIVLSSKLPETEKIRPVFDRRVKFFEVLKLTCNRLNELLGPELSKKVSLPVMDESKKIAALQAADLLAYETYKEVIARCEGTPPSPFLERLMAGRTPYYSACIQTPPIPLWDIMRAAGQEPFALEYTLFKRGKALRAEGLWGVP